MRPIASSLLAIRRRLGRVITPTERNISMDNFYPQQASCQIADLWFIFETYFGQRSSGLFIEVGANDGMFVSNTWGLAKAGWTGWLIEPIPEFAEMCRVNHVTSPDIHVAEIAIGECDNEVLQLQLAGALTTARASLFTAYKKIDWAKSSLTNKVINVESRRLDSFLEEKMIPSGFDLLVVDVEGMETSVFAGFDLDRWKPTMIIVELCENHPDLRETATLDAALYAKILDSGYRVVFKDSINTVLVTSDAWIASNF